MAGAGRRGWALACTRCGARAASFGYECAECRGPVVVEPDPPASAAPEDLLPAVGATIDLGQGDTPLVALAGHDGVWLKLESLNPTLSFKDRAMAVGVAHAAATGAAGVVVASTGNAAVSAAAYAVAAGLPCRVVIGTASRAAAKMDACRAYGAAVEEVDGDYSDAYRHAAAAEAAGWVNVSTTYRNPLLAEGYRPLAVELVAALGRAPAAVVVPIGAGPLLRGIERGFADAVALGLVTASPRMIGVQAAAVAPIAAAWAAELGRPPVPAGAGSTVATAIADPLRGYAEHAEVTLDAVRRTGGDVVAVGEGAIVTAARTLAAAGFWVEPSAATALAALGSPGLRAPDGPVVAMLTGHGSKAPVPS